MDIIAYNLFAMAIVYITLFCMTYDKDNDMGVDMFTGIVIFSVLWPIGVLMIIACVILGILGVEL